jgi:hypothetical protein
MLHEALLAMMIAVAPPGQSDRSVVVEPACGTTPGKPACDITPPPTWSRSYKAFVHKETRGEALQRYLIIARAIERVSLEMTAPEERGDGAEGPPPWPWAPEELARALVTIAHHESSFRRDVHLGVGPFALGDCTYWDARGRRVGLERAREPGVVATSCQSVCLMQLNTGGLERARFGFLGKEMVGLDEASTERCFIAGARALVEARARCAATRSAAWFARSVASYGTGGPCETEERWIAARVSTFDRIGKVSAATLPDDARALLAMDAAQSAPSAHPLTSAGFLPRL